MITLDKRHWDRQRLQTWVERFKKTSVIVAGDVGLDRYTDGNVERISPEAPVPIVLVRTETHKLGLAANVADNVRALGGGCRLCGVVGRDTMAAALKKLMRQNGISDRYLVVDASRPTVLKERVVSGGQQLLRVDYESPEPVNAKVEKKVLASLKGAVKSMGVLILQDYAKGLVSASFSAGVIAAARKAGVPVLVDPHRSQKLEAYKGATLIKPNKKEAEALTGLVIHDEKSLAKVAAAIQKKTKCEAVVITLGKDGIAVFAPTEGRPLLIPSEAREVFDVSGAGDTVVAVMAMGLAAGASLAESVILANVAAGIEVQKRGTATVSPKELKERLLEG